MCTCNIDTSIRACCVESILPVLLAASKFRYLSIGYTEAFKHPYPGYNDPPIYSCYSRDRIWDSVVGIVTRLGVGRSGVRIADPSGRAV
jgi:hypothetical protein